MTQFARPTRVSLQQPTLAKYRVPVFRELATRPGIDLTVYYAGNAALPNVEAEGFNARYVPMRRRGSLMWHAPQWRQAGRGRCDVLILSFDLHYASLVPALLRAKASGVRTVLWGHGFSKRESAAKRRARLAVMRLTDALLFYNHAAAETAAGLGVDRRRLFVAPNAIDQAPIQEAAKGWRDRPGELQEFRATHGLDDSPVLLFVSRLKERNRIDLLLEAAARLRGRHPGVTVAIVGDGPIRGELQSLADRLDIADRVRWAGAIYDEHELAPWFLSADLFCYPAQIGLSLLHAFGYGLPVITDDHPTLQNPEIEALREGDNGLRYRHGDAAALTDTIDDAIAFPNRRRAMGEAAHRTAAECYTVAGMVDGFEAAVRAAAGHAGGVESGLVR